MKLRNIFIGCLFLFVTGIFAQEPVSDYRRSSIYSVLVNHTDQQFANEIKEAFLQIPVPDKFNDHNLSVKVLTMDKKFWSDCIQSLVPYVPGEQPKDRVLIKLNSNENPYPPSPRAVEAIRSAANESQRRYPDP